MGGAAPCIITLKIQYTAINNSVKEIKTLTVKYVLFKHSLQFQVSLLVINVLYILLSIHLWLIEQILFKSS